MKADECLIRHAHVQGDYELYICKSRGRRMNGFGCATSVLSNGNAVQHIWNCDC